MSRESESRIDHLLDHWFWVVPILLVIAMFSFRQIDIYPPATDEFFSMNNAGWLENGPYSPAEVVQSLRRNSPDHTPLYFLLLSAWGNVAGFELASGRVLSVLITMLCLVMVYRLCRDFIAPVAGYLGLVVLASNAFFNFYIAHMHMYPLLLLCASIVLWLYLRVLRQVSAVRFAEYVALAVATFCLVSTHAVSLTFLAMLGAYHLLFATAKKKTWIVLAASIVVPVLLFSPYLWAMIIEGGNLIDSKQHASVDGAGAIRIWLDVMLNERPLLILLAVAGLAAGAFTKRISSRPYLFLFLGYLAALFIAAEWTPFILKDGMRHHLTSFAPFTLFVAAGLYAWYCIRKWLAFLLILWILAGAEMQDSARWWDYIVLRSQVFTQPSTHFISRLALQEQLGPSIIAFPYPALYADFALNYRATINYSQREHYFSRHSINMSATDDLDTFKDTAHRFAVESASLWYVHPESAKTSTTVAEAVEYLAALDYEECSATTLSPYAVVRRHMWKMLDCQFPHPTVSQLTELVSYQFDKAWLDEADRTLYFSDQWSVRNPARKMERFWMSWQLLNSDWQNVAQVDLPLVHPDRWRRFSIDVSGIVAGSYRLMAILYDTESGKRYNWLDFSGLPADMLPLAEVIIPQFDT